MPSILFGLASALFWGTGDFTGGLVSRHIGAVRATLYVQAVGFLPLLVIALLTHQTSMRLADWLWCGSAGVIGSLGFLALYRALAEGQMSIAAPVAALTSASLPVIVGALKDGLPSGSTLAGFVLALIAIWFVSQTGNDRASHLQLKDLSLPFLAGLGLGAYFIFVNQGSQTSVFAPLVAVRGAGVLTLLIFASHSGELHLPSRSILPLVTLNAIFDVGGSLFYILAGQAGRMDIAAVLSSLYSGVTVLLAWLILHEKITRKQWVGIVTTLMAIVLITL